jgi:5-methylcytosine-specific restriction protein A
VHAHDNKVVRLRGTTRKNRNARILSKEPLCRPCQQKRPSVVTAATQVDHITALELGGTEDESNLQPICDACHVEKTNREFGLNPWPRVGNDGWPLKRKDG